MRSLKIESGETIFICKPNEDKPLGEVWFLEDEWQWAIKLAKSRHDPVEQKEFMMGLVERKREDKNYCLFTHWPKEVSGPAPDPTLQSGPSDSNAQEDITLRAKLDPAAIRRESEAARLARKYNSEIQAGFRGKRA